MNKTFKNIPCLLLAAVFLLSAMQAELTGCTIFVVTGNNQILAGNNEDFDDPVTYIWFVPASGKKYGRVFWSLGSKYPEGGMNEKGLFYDGVSAPYIEIINRRNKPAFRGNRSAKVLEECGSVEEALALLARYRLRDCKKGALFIADSSGDAAVIEGGVIIRKKDHYFLQTNFYQSQPELGGYPCYRFATAEALLQEAGPEKVSVDLVRRILKGVSNNKYTQYSNICDLKNGIIYLFKTADFSRGIKFQLKDELKKGKRIYNIPRLFEEKKFPIRDFPGIPLLNRSLIARHPRGQKKSELTFSNGRVTGVSRGWFDNGSPAWEYTNRSGPGQGCLMVWHREGYPLKEYRFFDGKYTLAKLSYPGGAKLVKLSLKAGAPDKITTWNEAGDISFSGYYKNGLFFLSGEEEPFTGVVSARFKNGQVRVRKRYKKGKKVEHLEWDSIGRALKEK